MIRLVSTASLLALVVLVLYLPSAYPPEHFLKQLRLEHELNTVLWGREQATRILSRTLDWQATVKEIGPISSPAGAPAVTAIDLTIAKQMSDVNARLLNNTYFRSIDTLFALATYRFSALLEAAPLFAFFVVAALVDGYILRIVKSKEFLQHAPERFALYACATIMFACAAVVALVVPVTLPPLALCSVPIVLSVFVSRAVANFHRRG